MQSTHFSIQGFTRTYWDFFLGAGFTVGVLYLFAAILAWPLGALPGEVLAPIVMSGLVTACLVAAASLSRSRLTASTLTDERG